MNESSASIFQYCFDRELNWNNITVWNCCRVTKRKSHHRLQLTEHLNEINKWIGMKTKSMGHFCMARSSLSARERNVFYRFLCTNDQWYWSLRSFTFCSYSLCRFLICSDPKRPKPKGNVGEIVTINNRIFSFCANSCLFFPSLWKKYGKCRMRLLREMISTPTATTALPSNRRMYREQTRCVDMRFIRFPTIYLRVVAITS